MSNRTTNSMPVANATRLITMRFFARFDGRLLSLLGATTAAITMVGLSV